MKIFVYADVHANKQALQSLKKLQDFKDADMRIFLGDAISLGADSNFAVSFVQKYSNICLVGNNDSYPVNGLTEEEKKPKPPIKLEHIEELSQELSKKNKEYIKSWQKEYVLTVGSKKIRFLHFAWKSATENEDLPETYDEDEYVKLFGTDYDYTVFGHYHYKFEFERNGKYYYCVGSAGLKYPGQYTIIHIEGTKIRFERKTFEFDIKKFRKSMLKSKHKSAKNFVETRLEKYLGGSIYEN